MGVENWSSYLACYQVFVTAGSLPPCLFPGLTGHGENRACCVPSLALWVTPVSSAGHVIELFSPVDLLNGSHPTVPMYEPQRWGCHSTLRGHFSAARAGITHDTQKSQGVPVPRARPDQPLPCRPVKATGLLSTAIQMPELLLKLQHHLIHKQQPWQEISTWN